MTAPRIPDALSSLTTGGLAAISGAAAWIVALVLLPRLLVAAARSLTESLAAISAFRRESMWTQHENRFLEGADAVTGLHHIERVRRNATPMTTDQAPTSPEDDRPPPEPPP
ncbi:hypothetical protein [Streptomyces mirabilis]|jgi:hypothetical protein|uniref:hypothetical protein n=1 Tax=Streptomyces mirabilis TaxID=68239 RepID=UPI00224F27AF|nr:hypothetical protein [Streptomyces mirabilis]MCX4429223.1 hypothetical protein [Streptomyces mirabilis]